MCCCCYKRNPDDDEITFVKIRKKVWEYKCECIIPLTSFELNFIRSFLSTMTSQQYRRLKSFDIFNLALLKLMIL